MSFKALLKKYKEGTSTPEESAIVAAEIEKYESINIFLSEGIDSTLSDPINTCGDHEAADSAILRRAIRKKFILTGAISVAIVAMALLVVFFVLSPLMDRLSYQPLQNMDQFGETKLLFDVSVFTELHFPGIITSWATADSLGFGNYDLQLVQWDTFKGTEGIYPCKIESGKLKYLTRDFYRYPYINSFHFGVYPYQDFRVNGDADALLEIEKLPETAEAKAYISFKEDLPLDRVLEMESLFKDLSFNWIAVRSCDKDVQQLPQIGFDPSSSGIVFEENSVNQTKYPYLDLAWAYKQGEKTDIKMFETHFKSLLQYMSDNTDFLKLIGSSGELYLSTMDYINVNGVKSYGCLVVGHGHDVLAIRQLPEVDSLILDNVIVSEYSK